MDAGCGIRPSAEFRVLLEHERARSDRNGSEFSVIVLYAGQLYNDKKSVMNFIRVLRQRIRTTEEIGWLQEDYSIGVLLPDTPFQGAEKLAHDLSTMVERQQTAPSYKIYTYPSHWFGGKQEDDSRRGETPSASFPDSTGPHNSRAHMDGLESLLKPELPAWKRFFDITGALAGLVLLSPVFLCIAVLIKTVSPGPVFFRQKRVGFLGTPFVCWKFRTMSVDADPSLHQDHVLELIRNDEPLKKLDNDDYRIIPFGKILRKSCLDELPQLINVLRGEMSLVGPRPDVPYSVENYQQWQTMRAYTHPGLTGLWQIQGKNRTTFTEMIRMDINYVSHRSLWMDTKILLLTIPSIVTQILDNSQRQIHR